MRADAQVPAGGRPAGGSPVGGRPADLDLLGRLNEATPLAAALHYARLGWPVLPIAGMVGGHCSCRLRRECPRPAKHPLTPGGVRGASSEARQIRSWWASWPWAGVGVVTGRASGLVVVDVDVDHGGEESLAALPSPLPATLTARTGGGGRHLFYAAPDVPVLNSTGHLGRLSLPGVDVRGEGGYVVAPPSRHRSGRHYLWADLRPCASWPAGTDQRAGTGQRAGIGQRDELRSSGREPLERTRSVDRVAAYVRAALAAECDRVATAGEGTRNATLNRAAFVLGTLVGAGLVTEEEVWDALRSAAARARDRHGRPLRALEIDRTIASGLAAGRERPRTDPSRGHSSAPGL